MKRYLIPLIVGASLTLGGCSWFARTFGDTPDQATKTTIVDTFADACHTYATALRTAAAALNAKLLSDAQIAAVDKAQVVGDGVCKGPQPTNLTSAVVSVLSATASITLAAGSK